MSATDFELHIEGQENQPRDLSSQPDHGRAANMILLACSMLQLSTWGFVISYGVLQEQYETHLTLSGNISQTGLIGTTLNGVLYISLPIFSTLLATYPTWRRTALLAGIFISSTALVLSASSTAVWHLIVTQGILCGLGSALMFSPTTLYLDDWYIKRRSYAYGVNYAAKNIVGTCTPFLTPYLLKAVGLQNALRIWGAITFGTAIIAVPFLHARLPSPSSSSSRDRAPRRRRHTPWIFLSHRTFYIFFLPNLIFSSGYGLPQTYLPSFASSTLSLSNTNAALMLTLFNLPGIASCILFGMLGDGTPLFGTHFRPSPFTITAISALGSAISALVLWGCVSGGFASLAVFSAIYGFFASAYSSTWGGALKEIEREAGELNEAIDTGVVYSLFNGGRGVGFVVGGLAGVKLLERGGVGDWSGFGSQFGSVILYTGLSAAVGGGVFLGRVRW